MLALVWVAWMQGRVHPQVQAACSWEFSQLPGMWSFIHSLPKALQALVVPLADPGSRPGVFRALVGRRKDPVCQVSAEVFCTYHFI